MRAVLDTNMFVSATLIRGGNEDRILRAWQHGEFDLVISSVILEEIGRALLYEKIRERQWMSKAEVSLLLEWLAAESLLVSGKMRVRACRDPDDDKFLAAAVEGRARFLVSGDKDLLDLKSYRHIRIITSAAFLKILRKAGREA